MTTIPSRREASRFALRCTSLALLVVYLGWNLWELSLFQVPSSLFLALTGLPCPTTGGTRAMLALWEGRLSDSLRHNPLAVPIALLGCLTVGQLLRGYYQHQRLRLSTRWLYGWLVLLAVAWVIQLLIALSPK
ncbi:DUF2752 domain-containing protein [Roseimaritima ulvae]|uniref:DUF2752 domain-containing protein n=1 Tax=Roseimaritima ulvae TaxID=980254 RepID=A0A5B9QV20_9BACT|nr:DUF2752 domain-containing protein [Roseimaritima ulvae]QEG41205.1 hypothetical protein UC8_32240 [Roseimaritima ulvae]